MVRAQAGFLRRHMTSKILTAAAGILAKARTLFALEDLVLTIVLLIILSAVLGGFSAGEWFGRRWQQETGTPERGAHAGPQPAPATGLPGQGAVAPPPTAPPPPPASFGVPVLPPAPTQSGKRYYIVCRPAAGPCGKIYAGYHRVNAVLVRRLPGDYLGYPTWEDAARELARRTGITEPVTVI